MGRNNNNRHQSLPPKNLASTKAEAAAEARAQAEAYDSMFQNTVLELPDLPGQSISIPPHPDLGMLDDERMSDYEDLLFERDETYDREPDVVIPEQHMRDPETGELNGIVVPGETMRGALKRPYRITTTDEGGNPKTQLVKPPWSIKVVQAAIGETEYKKLREGGLGAGDVWRVWGKQGLLARLRQAGDPKSLGGSVDLEAVPEADS